MGLSRLRGGQGFAHDSGYYMIGLAVPQAARRGLLTQGETTMSSAPYTIYAIEYARRETNSTELFYGDYHNTPIKMSYFVWAVTNGTQTIVVPDGVPVVTTSNGDRSALAVGVHVIVNGERAADGSIAAARVSVGANGSVPPV